MAGPELGKAYVNIIPKAPGMKANMQKLLDGGTPSASSTGQKIGGSMLSGLKTVFAAAAVGKVIKDAIDAGADLQQSYGGLETIYGAASTGAKLFAENAALAGISANSYAEQAVSFGAALKQAFGGDNVKAMAAANTAIMDMADNSAKMGTPLQDIQNAYQGFAKQNYTMLDNLKLGYGGTREEMKRLLKDAEALTGVEYDISNLGDVYEAIHVIQGELGLTGVAALEARTTLSGSANAMKASWTNLMAVMSSGQGSLETALSNLGTTVGYFADNLIQMLVNISDTFPTLLQKLPGAITEFAPKLINGGAQIVANLATGLATAFPALVQQLPAMGQSIITAFQGIDWGSLGSTICDGAVEGFLMLLDMLPGLVGDILTGIINAAPTLIEGGAELIGKLLDGIAEAIPGLIESTGEMIRDVGQAIKDKGPEIKEAAANLVDKIDEGLSKIGEQIKPWWDEFSAGLVQTINDKLQPALDAGKQFAQNLWDGISPTVDSLKSWWDENIAGLVQEVSVSFSAALTAGQQFAQNLWDGIKPTIDLLKAWWDETIPGVVQTVTNAIPGILAAGQEFAQNLWEGIKFVVSELIVWWAETVADVLTTVLNAVPDILAAGQQFAQGLWDGIQEIAAQLKTWWDEDVAGIVQAVVDAVPSIIEAGKSFINGFWEGLKSIAASIKSWWDGFVGSFKLPSFSGGGLFAGGGGSAAEGSFATGLDYVPYDNFLANLHEGEMIVPARLASQLRQAGINRNTRDLSALGGSSAAVQTVTKIEFTGDLAQLARVLHPVITQEQHYLGEAFVT